MIRKITELSAKLAEDSKQNPESAEKRLQAAKGQAPRFLIISPIHRSSQDLQLFRFGQGDAFHATRVKNHILPHPDGSPFLFAGPAAYNRQFPEKTGVILTFDLEEPGEIVRASIENAAKHPDLSDIPLLAFRVNYERGDARLVAHGYDRAYELENYILKRISKPDYLDDDNLIVICSDSRVAPPVTPNGLPMAIQTLGAHVPQYDESIEETVQLNEFFEEWLSKETVERRIIVIVHGNFEGEGPSCGAAFASLNMENVTGRYLKPVIETLEQDALRIEGTKVTSPEDRVVSLGDATLENIKTYPSINDAIQRGVSHDEFMRILKMDTVTNVISPYEIEPL